MGRNGRAAERDARRAKALADDSAYRSLSESRGPSPDGHHEDGHHEDGHHDESIRARIVDALVALAAERGYARTSVSRIVELAGVPSPIFYEVFSDRHECFLAAFDDALARASTHVRDACDGANGWRERTRRGLTALLELFEDEPHVAGLLVVDSLEAGDRGLARRGRVLHDLVAAVRAGRHEQGDGGGVALTAEEVVHAALSVLEARLREGRGEGHGNRLVELVNPLMAMLVLPYHGLPVAALELTMPPSTGERRQRRPAESPLGQPVPDPRLSFRSLALLRAVAEAPDSSNRALARRIGITDEGQVSRMLRRLEQHDLVRNRDPGRAGRNAWTLSARGAQLLSAAARSADGGSPKAPRGSPKPVHSSKRRGPPG